MIARVAVAAPVVGLLAFGVPAVAQTSDRAQAEALARRAEARLRQLTQEAERLASEARSLLGDLRSLELDRRIKAEEVRRLDLDAASVTAEIATLEEEVVRLETQRQREQPQLEARLVDLYKLGAARYARLLLSASDLREAARASRIVAALARRDRDRLDAQARRIEELGASRATLGERSRRLETLRTEATRAQADAARAVRNHAALLAKINAQRDLTAQLAGELQLAHANLQNTVRTIEAGGTAALPSLPLAPFRGELDWPVAGTVRTRWRPAPPGTRSPGDAGLMSNGIEIGAAEGAPVSAIHGGTVAFADAFAGFGRLVILDHGANSFSIYGHLLEIAVARGAQVGPGQRLGAVGTPPAGSPGLYFELRVDGQPVDPLQWLRTR